MIFLDTSFLYPLFNAEDEDHQRVREVFESQRGQRLADLLVTTPQVISETITLIRNGQRQGRPDARTRHRNAVHAGERLFSGRLWSWRNLGSERPGRWTPISRIASSRGRGLRDAWCGGQIEVEAA